MRPWVAFVLMVVFAVTMAGVVARVPEALARVEAFRITEIRLEGNRFLTPVEAAKAVAYGLPKDEALKAVTLYAAQILGVADRVGSLTVGKDATLIVTDGDPLETPTHVEQMFIQGRDVDLTSRHTMLYEKYQKRYAQ